MGTLVIEKQRQSVASQVETRASVSVISDTVPDKVYIEKKPEYEYSSVEPLHKDWLARILDGHYGQHNFLELFHCLPEIFAPIHEIASRVADAKWELRNTWDDRVNYKDKAFNQLFTTPNPFMNIYQHTYVSVAYYLLTGRMFWSKNQLSILAKEYQNVAGWFALPAHNVWANQIPNVDPYTCTSIKDYIKNFTVRAGAESTQGRTFETDEVIPLINFSLEKMYDYNRNNSPLLGAEKAIKNLLPVYEARGVIYIKRGALGFLVSRKTDDSGTVSLSPGETKQLYKDYNETYGVTGGRQNVGITGQPIDYIQVGMSIKDLEPFAETLADAVAIYSTLRVPRHLVPSKDQGTFSNVDSSMKAFYDDVIIPLATMFAEAWSIGLGFTSSRKYIKPSYAHIDILQENKKLKSEVDKNNTETADKRYKAGMITINERNGLLDIQTADEETGTLYASSPENPNPLYTRFDSSTLTALQTLLANNTLSEESKVSALMLIYGISKTQAKKLAKKPEPETDPNNPNNPNNVNNGNNQTEAGAQE